MKSSKKDSAVIAYHIKNPDATFETMAVIFKTTKSTVSYILSKYYNSKDNKIYVVPSLQDENTYFAFNDINERKQLEDVGFNF